jgi:DNA-binding transcriptional regulator WhiA
MHDGTVRKTTVRIATNCEEFSDFLIKGIKLLYANAWKYREGRLRNVWIVEFSSTLINSTSIVSIEDKVNYIRGYFDAEGGIAKQRKVRYYLYFCQKNLQDLLQVQQYLKELNIACGTVHNPSKKKDPNY